MSDAVSVAPEETSAVDRVVEKTPWWAISTAVHVTLALIFAYMVVLAKPAQVEEPISRVGPTVVDPPPVFTENGAHSPIDSLKPADHESDIRIDEQKLESMDDDLAREHKGQDKNFLTEQPFNSKYRNASVGAGGGAGGTKGGPLGGTRPGGLEGSKKGTPRRTTDDAVLAALRWLARHQNPDGSWDVQAHTARCGLIAGTCTASPASASNDFNTGVTGLSVLAFLGAGYSHLSRDKYDGIGFGDVVKKGLQWLMAHQDTEGCVGPRVHKYQYNHAIGALALVEAYGLTGSSLFQTDAQRSIDFLVRAQNAGKAWRYEAGSGDNDTSVTGWAVMALKSAELSGITFPRSSFDGVRAWLDEVTEGDYYRAGYTHRGTGKVYCAHNQAFNHHEALTAIAAMGRIFMDKRHDDPRVRGGIEHLVRDLPAWSASDTDFYYWYYASLALFQYEGGQGERWNKWNEALTGALLKHQRPASAGCVAGSWEPVDRWGCEGGRVYATAINALTLEVYYRYANVFTGARK